MILNNSITDVPGIFVGHAQNQEAQTGCSVVLCPKGAVSGVSQTGGAPGTRETDAMRPMHLVQKAHAVILSGGSAFGLDAASGVMRYLEEKGVGFNTGAAKVPIVASAVLFDLALGSATLRPDAEMGYQSCLAANHEAVVQGNVGAGTGASAGKIFGMQHAFKTGIGSASFKIGQTVVGALIAVNPFGDIIDPQSQKIIAGARSFKTLGIQWGSTDYFADTLQVMASLAGKTILQLAGMSNTVIGVVATNARLNKEETNKVAQMAQDGIARTISPAHTMMDGDTIFALATGEHKEDVNIVGAYAARAVASAIINAVKTAHPAGGLPAYFDKEQE
ncbi:MAG: P1 family peptidase [Anaerolineae bacterium]|nr:P1 family peptidase [Anaerolineae bacterium]